MRLSVDLELDRQPTLLPERGRERSDPLGPWQLVTALRSDRSTRLVEPARREVVGLVDRERDLVVDPLLRASSRVLSSWSASADSECASTSCISRASRPRSADAAA